MATDRRSSTDAHGPEPGYEAYLSPTLDFLLVLALATALSLVSASVLLP